MEAEEPRLEAAGEAEWKDVDAAHADDPLFCAQYVQDIYANLRVSEHKHRPSVRYMEAVQSDINPTMRGILVDWLVVSPSLLLLALPPDHAHLNRAGGCGRVQASAGYALPLSRLH